MREQKNAVCMKNMKWCSFSHTVPLNQNYFVHNNKLSVSTVDEYKICSCYWWWKWWWWQFFAIKEKHDTHILSLKICKLLLQNVHTARSIFKNENWIPEIESTYLSTQHKHKKMKNTSNMQKHFILPNRQFSIHV